jgi:hypothetical protein
MPLQSRRYALEVRSRCPLSLRHRSGRSAGPRGVPLPCLPWSARGLCRAGVGRWRAEARLEAMGHVIADLPAAGNEGAMRFYRREGASDYLHTLIMPVRKPSSP